MWMYVGEYEITYYFWYHDIYNLSHIMMSYLLK